MKLLSIMSLIVLSLAISAATIDLKKSKFEWTGTKVTGKHNGTVDAISGRIGMDGNKITAGTIVLDMNSISTTDLSGKMKKSLDGHLKTGDFFEVEKHPQATISVKKVDAKMMTADLTIKGKTHEVKFPYTKKGNSITGTLKFDRTKFGIKYKSPNFFEKLGDKAISNEVKIDYKLVLR